MEGHVDRQELENAIIRTANRRGGVDMGAQATPSAVPESTKERPIILQWAERILAGDPKGTYTEYEFAAQLVILIPKVEALETRDAHFTPLMEALKAAADFMHLSTLSLYIDDEKDHKLWDRLVRVRQKARAALDAAKEE